MDYMLPQDLECFQSHLQSLLPHHFNLWFDLKYSVPVSCPLEMDGSDSTLCRFK